MIKRENIYLMRFAYRVRGEYHTTYKSRVVARLARYAVIGKHATLYVPQTRTVLSSAHTLLKQCIHLGQTRSSHQLQLALYQIRYNITRKAKHRPTAYNLSKFRWVVRVLLCHVTQRLCRCIYRMKNLRSRILSATLFLVVAVTACRQHTD